MNARAMESAEWERGGAKSAKANKKLMTKAIINEE